MIKFTANNKSFNVINELNELKVSKFKELLDVITDVSLSGIEREINLINTLADSPLSDLDMEFIEMDELDKLVNMLNMNEATDLPIQESVEYDGVRYKLKGNADDFKFSVAQMNNISKAMVVDSTDYIHKMMSFIYVSDGTSAKQREDVFYNNMTMDIVVPFVTLLITKYGK
jgi:hypothetical protein